MILATSYLMVSHYVEDMSRASNRVAATFVYPERATHFFKARGRLPTSLEEIGGAGRLPLCVAHASIEPGGSIRVVADFSPVRGRSILFTPSLEAGAIAWSCKGGDIPDRYRPQSCR